MITIFNIRNSNYHGGIETTLLGWNNEINRNSFTNRLFIFEEINGIHHRSADIMQRQGLPSEILPWGPYKNFLGALRKLIAEIKLAENTSKVILHSHDTRSDLIALIAGKLTGNPVVISNHAWHAVGFKRWLLETIRAKLMRYADLVINVSEDTHQETLRRGIAPQKSISMYSGIDLHYFSEAPDKQQARAKLGIEPSEIVIGDIARLWPEKAIDKLLEAAAALKSDYPQIRVLIVGDGPLEQELKAYCTELGADSHVTFLGFQEDLLTLYAAFDIFALPSSAEGTAMVIYSAMAMGVPIVASACSGVAEVLEHNRTALLITPAETDELTAALSKFIDEPAYAKQLAEAAKATVENEYSARQAIRKLEKIYTVLCDNRRQLTDIHHIRKIDF